MSRFLEQLEHRQMFAADGFEPDNSMAYAKVIPPGINQQRTIHVGGDVDFAKFTLGATSAIAIETRTDTRDGGTTSADLVGTLYDYNGNVLASSDDEGNGMNAQIVRFGASKLPAGTYYFAAKAYSSAATIASYSIHLEITPDFGQAAYQSSNPFYIDGKAPKGIQASSALGSALGNCTWFATGRAIQLGAGTGTVGVFRYNFANDFDNTAKAKGIGVVSAANAANADIRVGDLFQIDRSAKGEGGHVAAVERVNRDSTGRITSVDVSQSSYAGTNYPAQGVWYDYLYRRSTMSLNGAASGETYNFIQVQPRNSSGGTTATPTAPKNLTWTRVQAGQITMSWTDDWKQEQGQWLQYWDGSNWTTFGTVATGTTTSPAYASAGSSFYLRVVAYDATHQLASSYIYVTF
jgi:surface antigen